MAIKFNCPGCGIKVFAKGVGVSAKCRRCKYVNQGVPDDYAQVSDNEYKSWLDEHELEFEKFENMESAETRHSGLASGIRGIAWVISILAMIGSMLTDSDMSTKLTLLLVVVIELLLLLGVAAVIDLLGAIELNTRKSE
jgi:phage FluMu protein Com